MIFWVMFFETFRPIIANHFKKKKWFKRYFEIWWKSEGKKLSQMTGLTKEETKKGYPKSWC